MSERQASIRQSQVHQPTHSVHHSTQRSEREKLDVEYRSSDEDDRLRSHNMTKSDRQSAAGSNAIMRSSRAREELKSEYVRDSRSYNPNE